jgi:hypothetical protein
MCMNEISDVGRLNESDTRTNLDKNLNVPSVRDVSYQMG